MLGLEGRDACRNRRSARLLTQASWQPVPGLIEQWAVQQAVQQAGDSAAPPDLPHVGEIERLQAELRQADTLAAGAKAALPRLAEEIAGCQADAARSLESMHQAAAGVLLEEAELLAAELSKHEAAAARLMAKLVALARHFQLESHRGRQGAAPCAAAIDKMIPPRPSLDSSAVEGGISAWKSFTNRLFGDENATFEESNK